MYYEVRENVLYRVFFFSSPHRNADGDILTLVSVGGSGHMWVCRVVGWILIGGACGMLFHLTWV